MPTSATTASSSTVPQIPAAIKSQRTGELEGVSGARASVRVCRGGRRVRESIMCSNDILHSNYS